MSEFRDVFQIRKINNAPIRAHSSSRTSHLPGIVTCTLPFTLSDARSFIAIGCTEGIWVADTRDPDFLHRVLDLTGTVEFAIIEEYRLFLILADKSLYCYNLDALDPYSNDIRIPQKISGNQVVDFFRIGVWLDSVVIAYRKKNALDSIFRFLEPADGPPPVSTNPDAPVPQIADLGNGRILHFNILKEVYIPESCHDIMFFRTHFAILRNKGVELINKLTLETQSMLDDKDPRFKTIAKHCKSAHVKGISRTKHGHFLICYDTFGLLVDRYGIPLYDTAHIISWRGTVHTFIPIPPYVLLFKSTSLEVRDGTTGSLYQVHFGNMRCTWRGPSNGSQLQLVGDEGEIGEDSLVDPMEAQERSRCMFVMNASGGAGVPGEVAQHVYSLVLQAPS